MFVNPEVALESLPGAAELDWLALDPAFVRCLQTKALLRWATVAIVAGVASTLRFVLDTPGVGLELVLAGWGVVVLAAARALVWPLLEVPRRGYVVRDKDLVYKAGVLWRSVKAVPYNRVQHAETASGPLDRRFGLARLTVFTAGGPWRRPAYRWPRQRCGRALARVCRDALGRSRVGGPGPGGP